jgi:putative ABC transport system ATP-binding protein
MLLSIKNLSKVYHPGKTDVKALEDINLEIDSGEFTALCGPSGSGKTTLLNLIGCIDRPDGGEIFLDGKPLSGKTGDELALLRREYFGFIFQTYNLIPVLTAYENVELALSMLGKPDAATRKRVMETLEKVGLTGLENRKPLELSGGQQQRVSIARALVKKPRLILADEPTANLDSRTGEQIVELMRQMNENEGVTFVFSTHDALVMKHARRLVQLHDGRIQQ